MRDQPNDSNNARVCAGVMNSAPYFSGKPPCDSTLIEPARLTSACSITILTPGCARSVVLKTVAHSCALLIEYFSVTNIVASGLPSSGSMSAISCPVLNVAAVALSVDKVIGIGQNRPFVNLIPSQTPCQSACVMNPSRGVKPPMPSMMMSPRPRELTVTLGSDWARARSRASSAPCNNSGLSSEPPCGRTSPLTADLRPDGAAAGGACAPRSGGRRRRCGTRLRD
jgi:hypothetical protein